MLNLKNKLAKRILAFVLSGAMVVSGMSTSGITAYASQASEDTGGYYEETLDNTEKEEDGADENDAGKESSGKNVEETELNDNEPSSDTEKEEIHTEETLKEATIASNNESYGTVEKVQDGDNYVLTVKPATGYMFSEWTVPGVQEGETGITIAAANKVNTFTVPASSVDSGEGTITAVFEAIPTNYTWNIVELIGSTTIQGKTGCLKGLWIDATSGKLGHNNSEWAQANNNTLIKVPVQGTCLVTVTGYAAAYKVDDKPAATATDTFACKGKDGWVDIKMTASSYLKTIKVEPLTDKYIITVTDDGNGTASANVDYAASGDTITLTADPTSGYKLKEWKITDPEAATGITITPDESDGNKATFEMPEKHVTIQAVFEAEGTEQNISIADDMEHGTVTATEKTTAMSGTTVKLSEIAIAEADEGYEFSEWKVTDKDGQDVTLTKEGKDYTFTMPESDVTISAVFEVAVPKYAAEGKHNFANVSNEDLEDFEGIAFKNFAGNNNDNGCYATSTDATITVSLSDKATVLVETCCYYAGNMTSSLEGGNSKQSYETTNETINTYVGGKLYTVTTDAGGDLVLTFDSRNWYVHSITVTYDKNTNPDEPTGPKKIDVWDFGAKQEADTEKYNNNITAAELDGKLRYGTTDGKTDTAKVILGDGENGGEHTFGDVYIKFGKGDRIYADPATVKGLAASDQGTITFPELSSLYKQAYDDYTAAGGWYSNGSRSAALGYVEIKNVQAGDKIIAYMGNQNKTGDISYIFAGQESAAAQTEPAEITGRTFGKFTFVAKYAGTYKIYQSAGEGKPMYNRIVRIPTVSVSGTIDLAGNDISNYGLKFINQTDRNMPDVVAAVSEDGSFTAQLSAGYTYRALLTGVTGFGIVSKNNADKVETKEADVVNGKTGITLTVEAQETYTYSGTIEGFAADYDVRNLAITMVPTADFDANPVALAIDTETMAFNANLEPNVKYNLEMEGVNDYEIKAPADVYREDSSDLTEQIITVALKPMHDVIGGFIGLGNGVTVNSLKFTNVADNYEYTATVANGSYSISLRDGEYLANATVSDTRYSTKTHVIVDGGMVSQDLYFVSSADKENIDYVADIYVGYPKQAHNYKTVSEAVEAASLMKKSGNARTKEDRVIIHIAPGTYREQIIINTPYISFVNDTSEEVLLTWYYGIGYVYYSAGAKGYYDAANAYDKYAKRGVGRWGASVNIQDNADGFLAEGITFENSFNRYITDEELADGVEPAVKYTTDAVYSDTSIAVERKYGVDVNAKTATERAAAVVIEKNANNLEFYNCKFYSSQDTLYTSGGPIYFKNCLIEGQTDYIYGSGSCVFDACELSWKGYSSGAQGGYITANSPRTTGEGDSKIRAEDDLGYLFRNCTVTANTGLPVAAGYYGRPWGAQAQVIFMNTKLQNTKMIAAAGWNAMDGVEPAKVAFYEYKTTSLDGDNVVITGRTNPQMTDAEAAAVNVNAYFGESWTPVHYTPDATGTVAFSAEPTLTDNGDINVPNPGHTLTVEYSLGKTDDENDVSTIKWYIVDDVEGTNPALEKTSTAAVDKTYKITKAASGKYIKVEVTPETVDGRTGEAKSFILKKVIGKDYVDPSSGSGITIGDGINVYLAGDSTVKDYSAEGMWNGGKQSEDLGSWGEYLQSFFDEKEVTVQNFSQGGRSSRSFINDDTTKDPKFSVIQENISEGDYLFIQFGHNDSSTLENKKDVYTPIGAKGSDGKYPYTSGEKGSDGRYPDYYTYSGGTINWNGEGTATYCWFLQQYVDMALEAGAIPVIMSPVARMQYDSNSQTNKKHHADEHNTNSYYWEAAKQVYEDNKDKGVLFIDAYGLTTELFNGAYADGGESRGKEIMSIKDGTHNNKLGGMVEAMLVAEEIQKMDTTLAYTVKTPAQIGGMTTTGKTVFSINASGNFTAYEQKFTGNKESAAYTDDAFATKSDYWTNYGNTKLAGISKKAGELADSNISDTVVAAPKADSVMSDDADGNTIVTVTLRCTTEGAKIYYTDDGVTNPKKSDGTAADTAKVYDNSKKIVLTEDTVIKAFATAEGKTASKVVTFEISATPDVEAPTASVETGSTIASGTVIELETTTSGAQIRYTMANGSKIADPTIYSPLYDKETGLTITSSTTIKAIAVKNGVTSSVATFTYTVDPNLKATVADPTANIESGATVALKETISLRSATKNAQIYYTTDGTTEPTEANGTPYIGGIKITAEIVHDGKAIIKAIAVKDNMTNSAVVTFTYTVDESLKLTAAAPEADPPADSKVKAGDTVTLRSSTAGAKIVYTTDGTTPSATSANAADSPVTFTITESMVSNNKVTVKAIAISNDPDRENSEAVTITYKVESGSQNPPYESDDNVVGEDTKLKADEDEKNQIVNLNDTDKIEVKASNMVEKGKTPQYKVTVTYKHEIRDKDGKVTGTKNQELTEGVHYEVLLDQNAHEAGPHTLVVTQIVEGKDKSGKDKVRVTDLGTFVGTSKPCPYTVFSKTDAKNAKDISKLIKGLDATAKSATYTGSYITPEPEFKEAVDPKNYKLVYKNNVNAGKASVTVIATGDGYYGTKTINFTIKPAKINTAAIVSDNLTVTLNDKNKYDITEKSNGALTYAGNPIVLKNLSVTVEERTLITGHDYTVTYKNNAKVGKAAATIKAMNNYSGSITLNYQIAAPEVSAQTLESLTADAEYTAKKGPQVLEINAGGVTLKAGTDFKVDYKNIKQDIKNGLTVPDPTKTYDVTITGAGAYKPTRDGKGIPKDTPLKITVVKGKFQIKSGVTVDAAAVEKAGTDVKKRIAATKITDAAGTKPTEAEIENITTTSTTVKIVLTETAKAYYNVDKDISCHVAKKLSSVVKQKAASKDKTAAIELRQEKYFDGVNKVELTKDDIIQYYLDSKVKGKTFADLEMTADDFEIVSYKNNHKVGTATVTIEAKGDSPYWGTMNLKFKIITVAKPVAGKKPSAENPDDEENSSSGESSDVTQSSSGSEGPDDEKSSSEPAEDEKSEPATDSETATHTIWVVGDSTVSAFNDAYYYPRYGYGTQIRNYETGYYTVENLAASGRSSRSFLTESSSNYNKLKTNMKSGDVLIIGFGHNDEKMESVSETRYTNPNGNYKTEDSFAKSLYDNYVKIALDTGAQPILCTPIVRRNPDSDTLSGSDCHIVSSKTVTDEQTQKTVTYEGGDYPKAIRDLSTDLKTELNLDVPVVDLTALTKAYYERIGREETLYLHAWSNSKPESIDKTHLNIYGAKVVAHMLATELSKLKDMEISRHITNIKNPPTKEKDLVPNSGFEEKPYTAPTATSTRFSNYGIFKGSVFGDIGGANKLDNFTLGKDADGDMQIKATGNGKIANNTDGIAMYYYQIPANSTFTLSATATIKEMDVSNNGSQVAFGLMARDDMYLDTSDNTIGSDYVVAGTFGSNSTNCFYRLAGKLNKGAELATGITTEQNYNLKIVRSQEGYECTFGDNTPLSGGFDFNLKTIDTDYQYIGMFVAKNIDVRFSNIQLTVDGQAVDLKLP